MELNKLAIIGYGSMGSIHHKSINEDSNASLDAVFDKKEVNISLNKSVKQFDDYKKFLNYIKTTKLMV